MSKKRVIKIILEDILEEVRRIRKFTSGVNSLEEFSGNEIVKFAVMK